MTTKDPVTKEWETDEGMFLFTFEYWPEEPKYRLKVTIKSGTAAESPAVSPPPIPPFTPKTYEFQNKEVYFDLQSPDHNFIKGQMTVKSFNAPKTEFGIWCDFFYGPDLYRHFIGISVTFSTTDFETPAPTS